jgi:hypothetical protein
MAEFWRILSAIIGHDSWIESAAGKPSASHAIPVEHMKLNLSSFNSPRKCSSFLKRLGHNYDPG